MFFAKVAGLGILGFIILIAIAVGLNTLFVELVWNWIGLHNVFGVHGSLPFGDCVLVGIAMLFLGV